jgi:hypothetical protein
VNQQQYQRQRIVENWRNKKDYCTLHITMPYNTKQILDYRQKLGGGGIPKTALKGREGDKETVFWRTLVQISVRALIIMRDICSFSHALQTNAGVVT